MLLAAMLGLLLRLLVRGEYVFYVKPSFLPALIAAAVVLVLMLLNLSLIQTDLILEEIAILSQAVVLLDYLFLVQVT